MDGLGKHTVWHHVYVESKKYNKPANITKKDQTHRYTEQASGYWWWREEQYKGGEVRGPTIGCEVG